MTATIMPERDAVLHFLNFRAPQDGWHVFSGFVHALREARGMTARDPVTGRKLDGSDGKHGSWLGAVGYFTILDQIGKCLKPRNVPRVHSNSIRQALKHFTELTDPEINALYALRCAFAHDYSLYHVNLKKPALTHNFTVGQGATASVVSLPARPWDGDLENQSPDVKTVISLEGFADVVEVIVARLHALAASDELEIILANGSDELVRRYTFASRAD